MVQRFGPFVLDRAKRRLTAQDRPATLTARQMDLLLALTSEPGRTFSKRELMDAAWGTVAVTDFSLYRSVKQLRDTLGQNEAGGDYIETLNRKGYRFVGQLEELEGDRGKCEPSFTSPAPSSAHTAAENDRAIARMLDPYRAFLDGRVALETLSSDGVERAREAFAGVLERQPDLTSAHVGLATAHLLHFEETRADSCPDAASLVVANDHARRACLLEPDWPDAWGTLALIAHRLPSTDMLDAVAAARKAVALDPTEWRHHLRLAYVAGGAERLRAAQRVLRLRPNCGLSHWLAATVFIARQANAIAREHIRRGCKMQDAQRHVQQDAGQHGASGFAVVGLHLLDGMLLGAEDQLDAAQAALTRELQTMGHGHLFGREACANACYVSGVLYRRVGDEANASDSFERALEFLPTHPIVNALLGRALPVDGHRPRAVGELSQAIATAAVLSSNGRHFDAARLCEEALLRHRSGPGAAWITPIEPSLHVHAHPQEWARVLDLLAQRAA